MTGSQPLHFTRSSAARQDRTLPASLPSRRAGGAAASGVPWLRRFRSSGLALLLSMAGACAWAADWVIVPGQRAGPIDGATSEAKLVELFGASNITHEPFDVEPGVALPATVVFAADRERRAVVLWRDAEKRTSPESVVIRGERTVWKTDKGITLGTPLATLRRLNGKPLTLTGFGWDFAGTVIDSNGGTLVELGQDSQQGRVGRTLVVRLDPPPGLRDTPAYEQVLGEREFSSDSEAMRALNPRVYELIVDIAPK